MPTPSDSHNSTSSAPGSLIDSPAMALVALGRMAQQRVEAALEEWGISLRHLGALGHLNRNPDLSISDLARRAGITAQSMHATVNQLVALEAIQVETRGRGHAASLKVTNKGRALLHHARAAVSSIDDALLAGLDEQQRVATRDLLTGLAINARAGAFGGIPG